MYESMGHRSLLGTFHLTVVDRIAAIERKTNLLATDDPYRHHWLRGKMLYCHALILLVMMQQRRKTIYMSVFASYDSASTPLFLQS